MQVGAAKYNGPAMAAAGPGASSSAPAQAAAAQQPQLPQARARARARAHPGGATKGDDRGMCVKRQLVCWNRAQLLAKGWADHDAILPS